MKRKYINIGLIIFFILFAFILPKFFNEKRESDVEFYSKEFFPIEIKGTITNVQFSKGGVTVLSIKDTTNNQKNISVDKSFRYNVNIKKWNYFEKISNSNKCIYMVGDSIYYFDCYDIPQEIMDSLKDIEEWPRDIVDKWQIKKE